MAREKTKIPTNSVVKCGNVEIRLYSRANGMVALSWRENGRQMRTTRADWDSAKTWAEDKAAEIDMATGQVWISPARAERLQWLERLAGGAEEAGRLMQEMEEARAVLEGRGTLLEAARWFVAQGPPAAGRRTLREAVEAFVEEYKGHVEPKTWKPVRIELRTILKEHGGLDLLEVSPALLDGHCRRKGRRGDPLGLPEPRTVRNRMGTWTTFFNRCVELEWWPDGKKLPTDAFRRPRKADVAPEVFSPEVGLAILKAVRVHCPQFLSYVLIAGWLGLRPSEVQRIRRADFDWAQGLLHVCAKTAKKVRRERWVPIDPRVARLLRPLIEAEETHHRAAKEKATRRNARMFVSLKMRELGLIERWPQDVWRHSFITYRLQVLTVDDKTAKVAEEAGNSEREIRASYRRPIPPGTGERWWGVLEEVIGEQ